MLCLCLLALPLSFASVTHFPAFFFISLCDFTVNKNVYMHTSITFMAGLLDYPGAQAAIKAKRVHPQTGINWQGCQWVKMTYGLTTDSDHKPQWCYEKCYSMVHANNISRKKSKENVSYNRVMSECTECFHPSVHGGWQVTENRKILTNFPYKCSHFD